jgi:hypothetical protein
VPPDPECGDYDAARTLYQQVMRFIVKNLGPVSFGGDKGIVRMTEVGWNVEAEQKTGLGRWAVFAFAVSTPVLDRLLPYAPSDVSREIDMIMNPGNDAPIVVS